MGRMGIDYFNVRRWSVAMVFLIGSFMFLPSRVNAGFSLGDATNYIVLFEGGGNNSLGMNNAPTITGNIGIGYPSNSNPSVSLSGPLTINGNILFAGPTNITGVGGNVVVHGTISGGNANVLTDLNNLNTLSTTLGAEAGSNLTVNLNNNQSQTINASSGALDANGDRVFTVSSFNFGGGSTLTINGDGAGDSVVLNFSGNASFAGTIVLTNGLNVNQVLFNVIGGSNLTGGPTLQFSANRANEYGTFLDPNGAIQDDNTTLYGHLFGGDTHNEMVVSGASLIAMVPEPSTCLLVTVGMLGAIGALRRRNARSPMKT